MVCTSRSNTGSSPCVSCHKQHLCEQSTVARKLMKGDGLPVASLTGAIAKSYLFLLLLLLLLLFTKSESAGLPDFVIKLKCLPFHSIIIIIQNKPQRSHTHTYASHTHAAKALYRRILHHSIRLA